MRQAGFREASWTPYTFGVAGLYRGISEVKGYRGAQRAEPDLDAYSRRSQLVFLNESANASAMVKRITFS